MITRSSYHLSLICACTLLMAAKISHCFLMNYRGISVDGFGICPADMRNCSCKSYTGSESEIDCPKTDPTIQLRIEPRQYAELKCQRNRPYDFDQIPQLATGVTKRLTIDDCPFPSDQSILQFVAFLGTAQVKLLWLKNNANHEQSASLVRHHFEGLESLDRLAISNAKLADIRADLFEHLPNLTWLDMRDNIFQLPNTIFDALPRLRILELSFNNLDELEPRLLRNLPNLRLLTLWHNKLRNVNHRVFDGVPLLERLDLSANQLEALPSDLFAPLPKLSELALGFNNFRTLPEGLFRGNQELRKFKLAFQRVELETLPRDLLQNKPALEQVILEHIGIASLPATLLHGSANVTELNLAGNRLRELPDELLRDQRALRELKLQNNQLTSLPQGLLRNTEELRTLHLSHNQLELLAAGMLRSLNKLEELYLDHNQLHTINQRAFQNSVALRTLHLQANQLSFQMFSAGQRDAALDADYTVGAAGVAVTTTSAGTSDELSLFVQDGTPFQYLHALRELDLSDNFLTTVPRDLLVNTHELQRLNLTRNNITSLTYASLQFLAPDITVDLRHNSIFEIDLADMERLGRLETIDPDGVGQDEEARATKTRILLDDNPIHCNCIVYTFACYMQRRLNSSSLYDRMQLVADTLTCGSPEHLHGVLIRDVPPRELLCELDSPTTEIRHCPGDCSCFIRPADSGVIVNCSNQGLVQVPQLPQPSSFGYRSIELHVENNNITSLPETGPGRRGWNEVQELYASNNSIDELRPEQLPAGLRVLDLTRNKLTGLQSPIAEALASRADILQALRFAHNDWTCQCEAPQFLAFVHANARRIDDFRQLRCADGRQLEQTTFGDLCSNRTNTIVLACALISVLACVVALLSFVYYTYHLELKVWLFKHGICLWLIADEELDRDKLYDAFVSYSHKDEAFITKHLVPKLEHPPMNFRVCWHVRDWTPGEMISSQISRSVENSRRTIIVLSSNFLESLWGQLEFRTAHLQSMSERRSRLIIVIYGDIGNIDDIEPELRAYLHMNTYVRWGDPWFWDKIRFAMPHPPKVRGMTSGTVGVGSSANVVKSGVSTAGGLFMKQLQQTSGSAVDDKLELIKPQGGTDSTTPPALSTVPIDSNATVNSAGPVEPFTMETGNCNARQPVPSRYRGINGGHINGAFMINSNAKQSDV